MPDYLILNDYMKSNALVKCESVWSLIPTVRGGEHAREGENMQREKKTGRERPLRVRTSVRVAEHEARGVLLLAQQLVDAFPQRARSRSVAYTHTHSGPSQATLMRLATKLN